MRELNAKSRAFIDGWNDRKHPFVWTKTADDILMRANRCLLYTSDAADERSSVDLGGRRIIKKNKRQHNRC